MSQHEPRRMRSLGSALNAAMMTATDASTANTGTGDGGLAAAVVHAAQETAGAFSTLERQLRHTDSFNDVHEVDAGEWCRTAQLLSGQRFWSSHPTAALLAAHKSAARCLSRASAWQGRSQQEPSGQAPWIQAHIMRPGPTRVLSHPTRSRLSAPHRWLHGLAVMQEQRHRPGCAQGGAGGCKHSNLCALHAGHRQLT